MNGSKTFCILPWIHVFVRPTGKVYPCCTSNLSLGSTHDQSLSAIWNSPAMSRLRLRMLASEPDEGCAPCYRREELGSGNSVRKWANGEFQRLFPLVAQTRADGTLPRFDVPYLHIGFSNVCNFKCRTCSPYESTAWYQDARIASELTGQSMIMPVLKVGGAGGDVFEQLDPLLEHLDTLYFHGGEPLIQDEHYRLVERLCDKGLFRVRLRYSTNLSTLEHQGIDILPIWNRFPDVKVSASIDGSGERGAYIRKGLDWRLIETNRRRLLRVSPHVKFEVSPTLSVFNAWHMPDFHREWLEKHDFQAAIPFMINFLEHPSYLSAQILPAAFKTEIAARYYAHIDWLLSRFGDAARRAVEGFQESLDFIRARDLSAHLTPFRQNTAFLDTLRKESLADVFPELREIFSRP